MIDSMACSSLIIGKDEVGAFMASTLLTPVVVYAARYVDDLINCGAGKSDLVRLLAVMVLGKGTVYKNECVRFYNKQPMLCRLFTELTRIVIGREPKTTYLRARDCYVVQVYHKGLAESLLKLSPTYSTRLKTPPYPTLKFIEDLNGGDLKIFALRLLFSTNGTISPIIRRSGECWYLKPYLGLGYLSPKPLLIEGKDLLERTGMHFTLFEDRRFPDKGYLASYSWCTAEKFWELGGFLEGVLFLRGTFKGIEKNALLQRLISLRQTGRTKFSEEEADDLKRELVQKSLFDAIRKSLKV